MGKRTHLKPTETDHTQDAIDDAIFHAEQIKAEEEREKAEDEALEERGRVAETQKANREQAAKQKALKQFEGVCAALRIREEIIARSEKFLIVNRSVSLNELVDIMAYHGHDPDIARAAIESAYVFDVMDNFVTIRRRK